MRKLLSYSHSEADVAKALRLTTNEARPDDVQARCAVMSERLQRKRGRLERD